MAIDPRTCPACGCDEVVALLEIGDVPVYCNVLHPSAPDARAADRGAMDLKACSGCGHIFNQAFDPAKTEYDTRYENSLHYSGTFNAFAEALAERLVARHGLHGKNIVEIGCGKGDFLKMLCRIGGNSGIGFDRSYNPQRGDEEQEGVRFVTDFFDEGYRDLPVDFLCCRHVLEHVEDPLAFLQGIRAALGDREGVRVYFEVPNSAWTVEQGGIWDLIYEHVSYFNAASLRRVFERAGFEVLEVEASFGGQFLSLEAVPGDLGKGEEPAGCTERIEWPALGGFRDLYEGKLRQWRGRLSQMRADGTRAVVWGAGSKGVTFLNVLDERDVIGRVVDVNPHKRGKYVAGTAQEVVEPEALAGDPPELVLVMNPQYVDEIRHELDALGLSAKIATV